MSVVSPVLSTSPGQGFLGAMTPEQQLEALRRVQLQAEQRVKIGTQLFKAAEARLARQQGLLADVRTQQKELCEQLQADLARSLQTRDQQLGALDDRLSRALEVLDVRVAAMESYWEATRREMSLLAARAQALLDQTEAHYPPARKVEEQQMDAASPSEPLAYHDLLIHLALEAESGEPDAAA